LRRPGSAAGRRTFGRFLLFQVPGWIVAGGLAWLALRWELLSRAVAAWLLLAWVVKDFALYPLTRRAYEESSGAPHGRELVGARALVLRELAPEGYVRIGSESWRARLPPASRRASVPAGARVEVREVRGLTLVVEPLDEAD
jgi:membrane protein implicated in regulation of membrane protease activity